MNQMFIPSGTTIDAPAPVTSPFQVDVSRGTTSSIVSSQWYSRPDDQRFLSLDDLYQSVVGRKQHSHERIAEPSQIMAFGSEEEPLKLTVSIKGERDTFAPTHLSFGQLCQLAKMGRATSIFRGQPSWLAGLNLTYGLTQAVREEDTKLYLDDSSGTVRAATGREYGRIFDADVVAMVQKIAGNGTGDTRWKVPGLINWSTMRYNPHVDITKHTTTLYASDRDVFVFLVDDTNPIEIGKLPNGDPDLVFRGFIVTNSEVGVSSLKIMTFYLRGVCQNRTLWGVEDMQSLTIVHSKYGPERFAREAAPKLAAYASSDPSHLVNGIKAAKTVEVAKDDEGVKKFLTSESLGFSLAQANRIMKRVIDEEGHPARSAWDLANGITAEARGIGHTNDHIRLEGVAGKLMTRAIKAAA